MDIVKILIDRLDSLPPGDHSTGLKAVRLHIEAAVRHFTQGTDQSDETRFTDAIYRCNQAFEGSLKEAYRVLASKNPEKATLGEIESFLTSGVILRKKVLDQFANYRKEWRNPSTHDYQLDFDEDEALLAIVSVTAFAIVLCDQIESKLAFFEARTGTTLYALPSGSLLEQVTEIVRQFAETHSQVSVSDPVPPQFGYERVEGTLAGYLYGAVSPHNMRVAQGVRIGPHEVDIVVESDKETIVIELKVTHRLVKTLVDQAVFRATEIVTFGKFSGGVVLLVSRDARDYEVKSLPESDKIRIVAPVPKRRASS